MKAGERDAHRLSRVWAPALTVASPLSLPAPMIEPIARGDGNAIQGTVLGPDPRAGDPDGVGDSYDQFLMRVHRAFIAVLLYVLTSGACTHRGGAAAPGATPRGGILAVAQRVEHL